VTNLQHEHWMDKGAGGAGGTTSCGRMLCVWERQCIAEIAAESLLKLSCNLAGESQLFYWLSSAWLGGYKPAAWLSLKKNWASSGGLASSLAQQHELLQHYNIVIHFGESHCASFDIIASSILLLRILELFREFMKELVLYCRDVVDCRIQCVKPIAYIACPTSYGRSLHQGEHESYLFDQ